MVRSPAEVSGYLAGFTLGLRFLTVGTIVCLAVVGRGNLIRRLLVAFQAAVYLFVMAFMDATLVVVEVVWASRSPRPRWWATSSPSVWPWSR